MKIGAIILAAGFARRFGSDKRLALLNGKSIAQTTLATYTEVFANVRVVLRPEDTELAEDFAPSAAPILAAKAHLGMGYSLAAGIAGVDWDWAFIGLADMPYIKQQTLSRLIQAAATSDRLVLRPQHHRHGPQSKEQPPHGHPIGFYKDLFPALAALTGDQGARDILRNRQNDIQELALDDPGITRDIDHRHDLLT